MPQIYIRSIYLTKYFFILRDDEMLHYYDMIHYYMICFKQEYSKKHITFILYVICLREKLKEFDAFELQERA